MDPKVKAPRNPPYHKMQQIDTIKTVDDEDDELTEEEKRRRQLEAILAEHYPKIPPHERGRFRTEAELLAMDEAWENLD